MYFEPLPNFVASCTIEVAVGVAASAPISRPGAIESVSSIVLLFAHTVQSAN
jgi:hypothetical protein